MKRLLTIAILTVFVLCAAGARSQELVDKKAIIDSLTTINPDIQQFFPRWKVCETDLQIQIWNTFVTMGYDKTKLNMQNVQVLAAPKEFDYEAYEILMISCGEEAMNAIDIESNIGDMLVQFLSGAVYYSGPDRGYPKDDASRDYCYEDIPIDIPLTEPERKVVIDYLEPTDVAHAISVSLFEQSLKIGDTGFWLRSIIGTDQVGYPFWSSGESKIVLRRPLYVNNDPATRTRIPYLINAYLGGGYRISSGLNDNSSLLSWVKDRTLNAGTGGKLIGGLDFHMPFHPEAGISLNVEMPLQGLDLEAIDSTDYGYVPKANVDFNITDPRFGVYRIDKVAPILRATGQVTVFYNWWLDVRHPENFIRVDLGLSYNEVQEVAYYRDFDQAISFLEPNNINGLKNYKNSEAGDWIFLKAEYSNQATFPFGLSVQYSNQIFMGRVYIPLFNEWFYIEAKYATPLRHTRPYEVDHFFMISPVLRLTI